jgi:hypothetical protein
VALGYQGILQYAEFRKKAIKNYKQQSHSQLGAESAPEDNSSEDYFHNGHEILPEVTSWHKSLRIILRKTDTITSRVLDLIDNKMLLSVPTKRLSAEETCNELRRIYKEGVEAQLELDDKVPEIITEALRQLDDSAPAKALPKTPSEESSPDLHSRNAKSKRLEVPLMRTTHRSEAFKPEPHRISPHLVDLEEFETRMGSVVVPTDAEYRQHRDSGIQDVGPMSPQLASYTQLDFAQPPERPYSAPNAIDPGMYETPSRRLPAPHSTMSNTPRAPPQNLFEARQKLDKSRKGVRGRFRSLLGKQHKDEVLSSHFNNRDLISLPQLRQL